MSRRASTSARVWDFVSLPPGSTRLSCAWAALRSRSTSAIHFRDRGDRLTFIQERAITLEPVVAGPDLFPKRGLAIFLCGVELVGAREDFARVVEMFLVEQRGEPGIEAGHDRALAARRRSSGDVSRRPGSRSVLAAVVGLAVVPLALHAPTADAAAQHAREQVATTLARRPSRLVFGSTELRLCCLERLDADERLVGLLLGPDPFRGVVPAHLRLAAERDVVDLILGAHSTVEREPLHPLRRLERPARRARGWRRPHGLCLPSSVCERGYAPAPVSRAAVRPGVAG